jgi:hypothetical protein
MLNNLKSVNVCLSSRNKFLEDLIYDYQYNKKKKINYELFQIISIAFLKENNETLDTLKVNREFKQELFNFVTELMEETNPSINNLVKQYSNLESFK